MPSADTPIHPEENPSTTASPRSSMIRVPRRLLWFSAAVLTWFLVSEGATEAWYRLKEFEMPITDAWPIDWPTEDDAAERGFLSFQSREMSDREKELLSYETSETASWTDSRGNVWTAFHLKWSPDKRLNDTDIAHNPTRCLPAVGLELIESLPAVRVSYREQVVEFSAWLFRMGEKPVYVFVANRRERQPPPLKYVGDSLLRGITRLGKIADGNRSNPVELLEFVVVGPDTYQEASRDLEGQTLALFGDQSHRP